MDLKREDIDILDAALSRVLRLAYYAANREDDALVKRGELRVNEKVVGGAENVLRKFLFGTREQYEHACRKEGYGITAKEKH